MKVVIPFDNSGDDANVEIDTELYSMATVTIAASSGSPDGTVTVYDVSPLGAYSDALATYATPTTPKTFRGPAGYKLAVRLAGNSTGTISVSVMLR